VKEWKEKATKFDTFVKQLCVMCDRLFKIPNRSLLYDLYPYMWDMRGVLCLLNSFIKWLGKLSILINAAAYRLLQFASDLGDENKKN
jgi:hypothetical protein